MNRIRSVVKLQKQLSRRVAGKDYAKWVVTIPPSQVEQLGWAEGEDLQSEVKGHSLLLRPSRAEERSEQKD